MATCIFCRLIADPNFDALYRDDDVIAFADLNPQAPVHFLVVPRRHVDTIAELVKLDVLVGWTPVDALSMIVHRDKAAAQGRRLVEKLKAIIPRQMFEVPILSLIHI